MSEQRRRLAEPESGAHGLLCPPRSRQVGFPLQPLAVRCSASQFSVRPQLSPSMSSDSFLGCSLRGEYIPQLGRRRADACPASLTHRGLILYQPDVPTDLRAFANLQNVSRCQNQRVGFSVSWANDDKYDRPVAHDLNFKSQINCASKDCIIAH